MAKNHFKWKPAGYWELMQGEVGHKAVSIHTEQIASRANSLAQEEGASYGFKVQQGTRTRHKVQLGLVYTDNDEAIVDNAHNNTLAKAMGGA